MKKRFWFFVVAFFAMTAMLSGKDICLVKDGKGLAQIVVPDGMPGLNTDYAAVELQYHIKLITGATLPIVPYSKADKKLFPLYVGVFPAINKEKYSGEEYEVRTTDNSILMTGGDKFSKVKLDLNKTYHYLPRIPNNNNGVLWAVYDFLEKACDVRWYGPGEMGITYTPRKTLTVKPLSLRRAPTMQGIRQLYLPHTKANLNGMYQYPITEAELYRFLLRWRMTNRWGTGNHNCYSVYFKYWKRVDKKFLRGAKDPFIEHRPEYFAQGYKGQAHRHLNSMRTFYPDDPDVPPALCLTHPDLVRHFAKEAVDAYNGIYHMGGKKIHRMEGAPFVYPFEEDDNDALCKCKRCENMFKEKGKLRPLYIHYYFVNEVAKAAKKMNPNVNIVSLSYGNKKFYPHGMKLSDNFFIQMVLHHGNWFHKPYEAREMKIFDDWTTIPTDRGKNRRAALWTHYLSPYWDAKLVEKYEDYFPYFFTDKIGKFFKKAAERGVYGWFGQLPAQPLIAGNILECYISAMLAFDSSYDPKVLVDEFFTRYYGKAGVPLKKFYEYVEKVGNDSSNYPADYSDPVHFAKQPHKHNFMPESINWGKLGTAKRMKDLEVFVKQAEKLIETPMEKKRFNEFKVGLWNMMKRGHAAYERKLKMQQKPLATMTVPRIAPYNGDLTKAPWEKAYRIRGLRTIFGFPGKSGRNVYLMHDGTNLYLKYTEKVNSKELFGGKKSDILSDDTLQLFFAQKQEQPYVSLAITHEGKKKEYGQFVTADAAYDGAWNFNGKYQTDVQEKNFTIYIALPLKNLTSDRAVVPGNTIYGNIIRNTPNGGAVAWSPLYSENFQNFVRWGKITFAK